MAKALIPDELWTLIAAHFPVHPSSQLLHESRGAASSHVNGLVGGVGLSNELLDGSTDFADCGYDTSAAQMFIKPFSCWPVRSSAGGTLNDFVRDIKSKP
jgi:hypothetical protein